MNASLGLGFEMAQRAGERILRLLGAKLHEIAEAEAEATDEAGENEFAAGDLAEVGRIFEPSNGLDIAHRRMLICFSWR